MKKKIKKKEVLNYSIRTTNQQPPK